MNELLTAYVTSAIQVTLLSAVALLLHGLLGKRRPDTAVLILSSASLLTIALTAVTFVPLPRSWAFHSRGGSPGVTNNSAAMTPSTAQSTSDHNPAAALPLLPLLSELGRLVDRLSAANAGGSQDTAPRWTVCSAALIVLTIGLLLARLAGGVWTARRLLRSGCRIVDTQLACEVKRLREELGCSRVVELFTSPAIQSAATIGWRRPVLLLSSSWREWSSVELTAVLAHELTHVRRRDYLLGIGSRIATALHFYNPLVRRLGASMFVAQEAVADNAAARAVGGRDRYVVALSKLALRQDRQLTSLPVLALAFTSSTFLMRRIKMLQTKDGQRPSSRVLHGIVIGSMVILAVAASALRVPAHSEEQAQEGIRIATRTGADRAQAQPAAKVAAGVPAVRRSSFDLSYLPAAKQGMLGIRPNIIFARPDMQTVTAIIDAAIKRKLSEFGVDEDVEFSIADLEQALGPISVEVKDPDGEPGQRGRIMMTLSAVRSEKPLPLKEVLEATAPGTTVTGSESGSVLETPVPAFPRIGPMRRFAMPDDRTVLPGMGVDALENLKQRPVAEQIAAKPWFGLWQQVEQHMFAMLLNNSAVDWNLPLENTEYPQVTTLITHSKYLALAYDWQGDELNVLLIVDCQDAEATDSIVASLNGLAKQLIREAEKPVADKPTEADFAAAAYVRVLRAFETAKADVDGARVTLRASAKVETSAVVAYAAMYANELTRSAQPVSRGVTD